MKIFLNSYRQSIVIALILILTFLIFSPALHHEFVNLDDGAHITENPQVRSLSLENIKHVFTSTVQRTYIPLTIFSYALEYRFAGKNPFLYHLDNVLLHLLVVFLIFRLGIVLGLKPVGAGVAAFLFALHPMHVESVAWVTERKDLLYSVFYLGAVWWYLSFLRTKKKSDYAISLGMGFLSILAKPMALSLPLILILCDWFFKKTFKKEDWLNKIPYGLCIFPLAWITYAINAGIVGQNPGPGMLLRFWAGAFYLKKFFWPIEIIPHYLPLMPVNFFRFEYWSSVFVVGASVFVFLKWPNRWLRLAFLWYFLSIFFLLNFDYGRVVQMVADRYMYLPSVGFCFFLGYIIEKMFISRLFSFFLGKLAVVIFLVGIALFLSARTFFQVGVWKNSLVLWNYTIKHNPSSYLAFNNRGRIYERRRQFELAMADYKEAIRLNPNYEKAYKNMAMVYEGMGDPQSAFDAYTKAIEIKSSYFEAYNNRALLFEKKGDNAAALKDYDHAIAANPNYVLGYANRGALYLKLGEMDRSFADLTYAITLNPNFAEAYKNRAAYYLQMNMLEDAMQDCQQVIHLNSLDQSARLICDAVYKKMQIHE